jgi:5-methyltetrahydropteroyltriglutamate--homocysteine methyltransferase
LLEYDTPRAGDFARLRFVPKDKIVALGRVSTKVPEVERPDDLCAHIEEATRYLPIEQLCICPQCGFASEFRTARLIIDDKERELANLVKVAERIWG